MLTSIVIASSIVALLSVVGVFVFGENRRLVGAHRFVLPAAVGVFLGVVFFELIPETLEMSREWGALVIVAGFMVFYLLSHLLETFHHHHFDDADECSKNGAQMLLVGDTVHNLADGVVIATAFMVNPTVGIATTIGIALHELPQEIAEFGVLLRAGYAKRTAAFYNFISALSVVAGALLTYFFASTLNDLLFIVTGVAAGNLLYVAAADLIPELRESHREHFAPTFIMTVVGVAAIYCLISFTHTFGVA